MYIVHVCTVYNVYPYWHSTQEGNEEESIVVVYTIPKKHNDHRLIVTSLHTCDMPIVCPVTVTNTLSTHTADMEQ